MTIQSKHTQLNVKMATLLAILLYCLPALAVDRAALLRAISGPDRDVTDFARDESRKPIDVLDFIGIEEGMAVLDVYAAGGYYTFIMSKAVGPAGTVYAQNTERGLRFKEDRQEYTQGEALANKIERGQLSNVRTLVGPVRSLPIQENSLDAILLAQTLHDTFNNSPSRALNLLLRLKSYLKPGGVIGVTDHIGEAGNDNADLHRMELNAAIELSEEAGFIVQDSDVLRNPADDHSRSIFDPRLVRNTDRFLLRLIKPD